MAKMDSVEELLKAQHVTESARKKSCYTGNSNIQLPLLSIQSKMFELNKNTCRDHLVKFRAVCRLANISSEYQVDLLVTMVDYKTLRLIDTLNLSSVEKQNPEFCFSLIQSILMEPGYIAKERAKMLTLKQEEDEHVVEYAARVLECIDFVYLDSGKKVNLEMKESVTLDIFVAGLKSDKIHSELLKGKFQRFNEAYRRALKLEHILIDHYKNQAKLPSNFRERRNQETVQNIGVQYGGIRNNDKKNDVKINSVQNSKPLCTFCKINGHTETMCNKKKRKDKRIIKRKMKNGRKYK